eukprot:4860160-Amphidinium_carterae.1
MAEAKALSDRIDKQTKVIEEAVTRRDALQEKPITACIKLENRPKEPLLVPKPSVLPALAPSSALKSLLALAKTANHPEARALAEKMEQERKSTVMRPLQLQLGSGIPAWD